MRVQSGFLLALLFGGSPLFADILYSVTDLGTLPGYQNIFGRDINNAGQVTGYSEDFRFQLHAFLYSNGQMSDLGTLGGSSIGSGINDAGQVVGGSVSAHGSYHAVLYSNGQILDLGTLPGGSQSIGNGINNAGQVVGSSDTSTDPQHAFLYSQGQMTDLGPGVAYAINNLGQVVGSSGHAFLYSNGQRRDLGTLQEQGCCSVSEPSAINETEQVVGRAYNTELRSNDDKLNAQRDAIQPAL